MSTTGSVKRKPYHHSIIDGEKRHRVQQKRKLNSSLMVDNLLSREGKRVERRVTEIPQSCSVKANDREIDLPLPWSSRPLLIAYQSANRLFTT